MFLKGFYPHQGYLRHLLPSVIIDLTGEFRVKIKLLSVFCIPLLASCTASTFQKNSSLSGGGSGLGNFPPPGSVPFLMGEEAPEGLLGGHFDLDTASKTYALGAGTTDHHIHEYDDKYKITGANFFKLEETGLGEINEIIKDATKRFVLLISNAELSQGGVVEVNGGISTVLQLQQNFRAKLGAGQLTQIYTLGVPTQAGDQQLKSLKIYFGKDVILNGGLIPTATGCVRRNDAGAKGEYRNGALVIQAIPVDSININPITYTAANGASNLLWESTIFWHRDGTCYGFANYVR
jgi:hypothetical protein